MINYDIDVVVPFVDNKDPVWRENTIKGCKDHFYNNRLSTFDSERFDNPGLFEYCLKGIDKFMPWVRKIHLIVSNIEQVPNYINKEKTHIVLHKDIIPDSFLPTWNSTTIEMFIYKIDGLAEHFIYFNDDMYPTNPLKKEDFFENFKVRVGGHREKKVETEFQQVCRNNYQTVLKELKLPMTIEHMRPFHGVTPMVTSHCRDCQDLIYPIVYQFIAPFRNCMQHNQYVYPIYEYLVYGTAEPKVKFKYTSLKKSANEVCSIIRSKDYNIICINDVLVENRAAIDYEKIKNAFKEILE